MEAGGWVSQYWCDMAHDQKEWNFIELKSNVLFLSLHNMICDDFQTLALQAVKTQKTKTNTQSLQVGASLGRRPLSVSFFSILCLRSKQARLLGRANVIFCQRCWMFHSLKCKMHEKKCLLSNVLGGRKDDASSCIRLRQICPLQWTSSVSSDCYYTIVSFQIMVSSNFKTQEYETK